MSTVVAIHKVGFWYASRFSSISPTSWLGHWVLLNINRMCLDIFIVYPRHAAAGTILQIVLILQPLLPPAPCFGLQRQDSC